jgi:hypothetical protein
MTTASAAEKLTSLLEGFSKAAQGGQLERYRQRRWERAAVMAENALPDLSHDQGLALYRASGGNRVAQFRVNPIAELRDSLDFLLYDNIRLEARFDECAAEEGGYKLAGAGKEFVSFLLCLRDPGLFAHWNSNTERMLRVMGNYPPGLGRGRLGNRYMDLLDALQGLCIRTGLADFQQVDEFAYFVVRLARSSVS